MLAPKAKPGTWVSDAARAMNLSREIGRAHV